LDRYYQLSFSSQGYLSCLKKYGLLRHFQKVRLDLVVVVILVRLSTTLALRKLYS
jgi:hypothetical protein